MPKIQACHLCDSGRYNRFPAVWCSICSKATTVELTTEEIDEHNIKVNEAINKSYCKNIAEGKETFANINDAIDAWHEGDSDVALYVFLGMTQREYNLFVKDAKDGEQKAIARHRINNAHK